MSTNASLQPPVEVGHLFSMSWGYDQTNVNYFQVTRVSAKGVFVREIGAQAVPGTAGFMCSDVKPTPGNFLVNSQWCGGGNRETFRRLVFRPDGSAPHFNFEGRYFARRISADTSTYNSWYA